MFTNSWDVFLKDTCTHKTLSPIFYLLAAGTENYSTFKLELCSAILYALYVLVQNLTFWKWKEYFHSLSDHFQISDMSTKNENILRAKLAFACKCSVWFFTPKSSEEEQSFNECRLTYCAFLLNSLIPNSVIVGITQDCQSMQRPWLALILHCSAQFTGISTALFSVAFSLVPRKSWGAILPFKLIIQLKEWATLLLCNTHKGCSQI